MSLAPSSRSRDAFLWCLRWLYLSVLFSRRFRCHRTLQASSFEFSAPSAQTSTTMQNARIAYVLHTCRRKCDSRWRVSSILRARCPGEPRSQSPSLRLSSHMLARIQASVLAPRHAPSTSDLRHMMWSPEQLSLVRWVHAPSCPYYRLTSVRLPRSLSCLERVFVWHMCICVSTSSIRLIPCVDLTLIPLR